MVLLGFAVMLAVVGPMFLPGRVRKAKAVAAELQIESFQAELRQYKRDTGSFPTNEQGLEVLRIKPTGVVGWRGPYASQEIPLDPWGHAYGYRYPGSHGTEPDIWSLGADGKPGGTGRDADIVSWKK